MLNRIGIRQLQSEAYALRLMRKIHGSRPGKEGVENTKGTYSPQTGVFYTAAENVASYARQAVAYAAAADSAPIEVMPVVRYYQMLHTIKSLLYLFKLDFPTSTSVLQHGLSVRRIKRSGYRWPLEKLTVHKEGIIQSFHQLLSSNPLPEKLLVGDLIGSLPQLAGILGQFYDHLEHAYPLYTRSDSIPDIHPAEPVSIDSSEHLREHAAEHSSRQSPVQSSRQSAGDSADQSSVQSMQPSTVRASQGSTGRTVGQQMQARVERRKDEIQSNQPLDASEATTGQSSKSSADSTHWEENVLAGDASQTGLLDSPVNSPTGITSRSEWGWVSRRIASNQGMTVDEWKQAYINAGHIQHVGKAGVSHHVATTATSKQNDDPSHRALTGQNLKGYLTIPLPDTHHPWFNSYDGVDYLVDDPAYPVYLVQYGLLYCLSALSRYSATEWSDIIHWNNEQDALLVREYLRLPFPRPLIRLDDPISPQSIEWIASGQIVND